MEGKSVEEKEQILKKMMGDGLVRFIMERSESDLLKILFSGFVPKTNNEGVDVDSIVYRAITTGYALGASICSDCYDDNLEFDFNAAEKTINKTYELFEKQHPGLCYLEDDVQNTIKALMAIGTKYAVEHVSKGQLLDLLIGGTFPDWIEIGGLTEDEVKDIYTPKPLNMGEYCTYTKSKFNLYEEKKEFISNSKKQHEIYCNMLNQNDDKVIERGKWMLEAAANLLQYEQIDFTLEGVLKLSDEDLYCLHFVLTRKQKALTKPEGFRALKLGICIYHKILDELKNSDLDDATIRHIALEPCCAQASYYASFHTFPAFLHYSKVLEMHEYIVQNVQRLLRGYFSAMQETARKRMGEIISSLYFDDKEIEEAEP